MDVLHVEFARAWTHRAGGGNADGETQCFMRRRAAFDGDGERTREGVAATDCVDGFYGRWCRHEETVVAAEQGAARAKRDGDTGHAAVVKPFSGGLQIIV